MDNKISVIIPNRNGQKTIGLCLEALYQSRYDNFEVIVVDDGSVDNSVEIIKKYPCTLIRLPGHSGAAKARNVGAGSGSGSLLFFTDADCIVQRDTLSLANMAYNKHGSRCILGGTYTKLPYDNRFFSIFQSLFIHYSETKKSDTPDYIASHAMVIGSDVFTESGGFNEDFLPMIEDVEFSHRLKRSGLQLRMVAGCEVRHVFDFSLIASLRNAYTKSKFWTVYSLKNGDICADSGTASLGLKLNVFLHFFAVICLIAGIAVEERAWVYGAIVFLCINVCINMRFLTFLFRMKGAVFALLSGIYYVSVYPFPVGFGALAGNMKHLKRYV